MLVFNLQETELAIYPATYLLCPQVSGRNMKPWDFSQRNWTGQRTRDSVCKGFFLCQKAQGKTDAGYKTDILGGLCIRESTYSLGWQVITADSRVNSYLTVLICSVPCAYHPYHASSANHFMFLSERRLCPRKGMPG